MDGKITCSELQRLIESTYQYIYSVEDMRISRRIAKVEDLFTAAPMSFDTEKVSSQLLRLKKLKQNADMLKSHLEVYNEKMDEQKRNRELMKSIIKKHNIDVSKPVELSNGEKHIMTCNEDYSAYLTYQENRFFSRDKAADKANTEAKQAIKAVIKEVTSKEELRLLGKYIEQLMPQKMQRVFL